MDDKTLIRMANQIAYFFAPYPHDEAVKGVAGHIKDFWDPRMKKDFFAAIDAGAEGLHPLVVEAAKSLRAKV